MPLIITRLGIFYEFCLQLLKITTFLVLFVLTLISAVLAKTTFLLMSSAIGQVDRNISICPDKIPGGETQFLPLIMSIFRSKNEWSVSFKQKYGKMGLGPSYCFMRAWNSVFCTLFPQDDVSFRKKTNPHWIHFRLLHRIVLWYRKIRKKQQIYGCTFFSIWDYRLVFRLDPIHACTDRLYTHMHSSTKKPNICQNYLVLMLSNAVCLVPAVLTALSRHSNRWLICFMALDIVAIGIGSTIFWALPVWKLFRLFYNRKNLADFNRPRDYFCSHLLDTHFFSLVAKFCSPAIIFCSDTMDCCIC